MSGTIIAFRPRIDFVSSSTASIGWGVRSTARSKVWRRIQRRQLLAFHKANWCPTRTVIAFCGDVDPVQVRKLFDRLLRRWAPKKPLSRSDQLLPDLLPRADVFPADRQQVHVYLGHLGVRRADPRYPALVLMDHVLGTGPGFSNRISRRLRDEEGLAYSVHADIHSSAGVFPGMFTAYIGTSPEHLERAVAGLLEEIRRIQEQPVERDELELARSYLLGSYALGFERAARRVNYMISAERFRTPPRPSSRADAAFQLGHARGRD